MTLKRWMICSCISWRTSITRNSNLKAIPQMASLATNADLKAGLKSHVIDTQNQIERLDKVFAKLGISSRAQLDRVLPAGPTTA